MTRQAGILHMEYQTDSDDRLVVQEIELAYLSLMDDYIGDLGPSAARWSPEKGWHNPDGKDRFYL